MTGRGWGFKIVTSNFKKNLFGLAHFYMKERTIFSSNVPNFKGGDLLRQL